MTDFRLLNVYFSRYYWNGLSTAAGMEFVQYKKGDRSHTLPVKFSNEIFYCFKAGGKNPHFSIGATAKILQGIS